MFLSLRSVSYEVDDLEKAREWYSDFLDSKPVIEQSGSVTFLVGADRLVLNHVEHPVRNNGTGQIAYWGVSDLKVEYPRILGLGASKHGDITDLRNGYLLAQVKDPFGNTIGLGGMGGTPDNRAIEEKPSETALLTTLMRAFAATEMNVEIRGHDSLAKFFLPGKMQDDLARIENRDEFKGKHFILGLCEYVMARTHIFDQFYRDALNGDIDQIVLLGAGYDTRPYRYENLSGSIKIFELDTRPTQERKKRCLSEACIKIPDFLTYVPINFNSQSLKDVLFEAGFNPDTRTLFVWEGVTYYLGSDAVDATLKFIRSNAAKGSMVAFDYIAVWPGVFNAYGFQELVELNASKHQGESGAAFSIERGAIKSFLSQRGFEIVVHQNTEELEKNFLTTKDGVLYGHATGGFRIVQAMSKG